MGRIDEKAVARSKKEKHNVHPFSRRTSNTGGEIKSNGSEQERIDRADSSRDEYGELYGGKRFIGEIICQLIEDCKAQEAEKLEELEAVRSRRNQLESLLQEISSHQK